MALFEWFSLGRNRSYDVAIRAFDEGNYEEAIARFEQCLGQTDDPATVRLAKFYVSESYSHLAQQAMQGGSFDRSVQWLDLALAQHPNYPDLHYGQAFALRKLGRCAEAICALNKALEINPRFARGVMLQGLLWYEGGRSEDGLKRMEHATTLDDSLRNERFLLAIAMHEDGDTEMAAGMFEAATSRGAEDSLNHARWGDEALKAGRYEEAANEYSKAISITPHYADLLCKYGTALICLGHAADAAEQIGKALALNPRYLEARYQMARAQAMLGDRQAAIAVLDGLLKDDAGYPGASDLRVQLDS